MRICGYENGSKVELENLYEVYAFVSDIQTVALTRGCEVKANRKKEVTTLKVISEFEDVIIITITAPEI